LRRVTTVNAQVLRLSERFLILVIAIIKMKLLLFVIQFCLRKEFQF